MRRGTILQLRIDLLDDRVSAMNVIISDSIETVFVGGGEERVVPEQIEQSVLSGNAFGLIQFGDASDHQTARSLQRLLLRSERGERDLSNFSLTDPGPGVLVIDRFGVLDASPCVVADCSDRCFDPSCPCAP